MSASCCRIASRLNCTPSCTPSHWCRRLPALVFIHSSRSTAPHCFYPLCLFCCFASVLPRRAPGPISVVRYCSTSARWKKKKKNKPFRTNQGHCASCYKKWALQLVTSVNVANVKQCFISSISAHRPSWRVAYNSFTWLKMPLFNDCCHMARNADDNNNNNNCSMWRLMLRHSSECLYVHSVIGAKGPKVKVTSHKNIAGVGLCTLVGAGFF